MKRLIIAIICLFSVGVLHAQHGQVYETRQIKSSILKMGCNYAIYLPPGYDKSDQSYPVLYLLHGSGDNHTGWVQFGQVQHIAEKAIADGTSAEMIIVMPDADTGTKGYFNALDGKFNYEDFFFEELIPHIEKEYRVRSDRRYRAVSGLSMGGGRTIFYALHRPDLFAAAAPLSAATGNWDLEQFKSRMGASGSNVSDQQLNDYFNYHSIESIIKSASEDDLKKIKGIRWYISCGDDDFLYEGNANLHVLFHKNEIQHEYRVKDGGHTWSYWRQELPLVLEFVSKSFMQY